MLQREEFVIRELLESGVVDQQAIEHANEYTSEHGGGAAEALVEIGAVSSRDLSIALASVYESSFVELEAFEINLRNASLLPRSIAEKHTAFPLFKIDDVVTVGMIDPMDFRAVDQLRQALKCDVETVLCEPQSLRRLIARSYSIAHGASSAKTAARRPSELTTGEEPIVAAVNETISSAIEHGASDIHLSPDDTTLYLRYRIDGVLRPQQGPPLSSHGAIVRRLKVMSNLDLTQTRKPQDGKFRFTHRDETHDLRLSVIPTVCGESVVLRILRKTNSFSTLAELGFPGGVLATLEESLEHPHGMILVTGPTGSGKTTTLYTALARLNTPERNIMTVEDPVEIRMPMVRQTQVNSDVGMTFASALRSMLRQDPDVMLVGEIRDGETGQIAVQASLTGHLVLSTLHTNDAVGAVERLRDLGVPSFALNSALLCVIAQRLVRRVCENCVQQYTPSPAEIDGFRLSPEQIEGLRVGAGCSRCQNTGYFGRFGVYEALRTTADVQQAIHDEASPPVIRAIARQQGMQTMLEDGLEKAARGLTTLEELVRVRATVDDEVGTEEPMRLSA